MARLFHQEHRFHPRPPFAGRARGPRLLARIGLGPPTFGRGIGRNVRHVCVPVFAVIFEIAEESIVLQEDRVVAHICPSQRGQHVGPCRRVQPLVLIELLGPDVDNHGDALHGEFPLTYGDVRG